VFHYASKNIPAGTHTHKVHTNSSHKWRWHFQINN